jgi:hypothetical protein
MKRITNKTILKTNIRVEGIKLIGKLHPPQNKTTFRVDIIIIFAYSAMKNRANPIELYSTLYPATSSASASGRSNGGRLVSANVEIKKTTNKGNSGTPNQMHAF